MKLNAQNIFVLSFLAGLGCWAWDFPADLFFCFFVVFLISGSIMDTNEKEKEIDETVKRVVKELNSSGEISP